MERRTWAIAIIMIYIGAPFSFAGNYPEKTQRAVSTLFANETSDYLQKSVARYNSNVDSHSALVSAAKAAGLSEKDARGLAGFDAFEGSLPKAQWIDSRPTIEDSGYTITIDIEGPRGPVLRVNDSPFAWKKGQSFAENLKRYESLFHSGHAQKSSGLHFPGLFSDVWASDLLRIKAAGLQLYFVVSDIGEIGGQLERVNGKVKDVLALCEAPEAPAGQDDPFLKEVMQGPQIAQRFGESVLLRNCDDVKNYAHGQGAIVHGVLVGKNDYQDVNVGYRLPDDLCKNLDHLARCIARQMGPPGVSSSKKKPVDKEEWHEPSQSSDKKAGAAH